MESVLGTWERKEKKDADFPYDLETGLYTELAKKAQSLENELK